MKHGIIAESEFIEFLRNEKSRLKRIEDKIPPINSLALYYDKVGKVLHAGRVIAYDPEDGTPIIESKFGVYEFLLHHKAWNVPRNYGSEIEYYEPISLEELEKLWEEYIEWLIVKQQEEAKRKNLELEEQIKNSV